MSFGSKNEKNSNSRSIICQGNLEGRLEQACDARECRKHSSVC